MCYFPDRGHKGNSSHHSALGQCKADVFCTRSLPGCALLTSALAMFTHVLECFTHKNSCMLVFMHKSPQWKNCFELQISFFSSSSSFHFFVFCGSDHKMTFDYCPWQEQKLWGGILRTEVGRHFNLISAQVNLMPRQCAEGESP